MKKQLWITGVDLRGQTVVRWYIEQTHAGWTLKCDAASLAPCRLEPFESARGRYELVALFLTCEQFEECKAFLERFNKKLKTAHPHPIPGKQHGKMLKEIQRQVLLLYEMGEKEEDIARSNNMTVAGVKKLAYRLRKQHGFTKTSQMIKFFRASSEL